MPIDLAGVRADDRTPRRHRHAEVCKARRDDDAPALCLQAGHLLGPEVTEGLFLYEGPRFGICTEHLIGQLRLAPLQGTFLQWAQACR